MEEEVVVILRPQAASDLDAVRAVEGSADYYGARGFTRAADHGFVRPSVRIPEAAFQVAVLPAHEAWTTGTVVYTDAFWATDSVGLRDPLPARPERG
jgi:putative acetyltransferase